MLCFGFTAPLYRLRHLPTHNLNQAERSQEKKSRPYTNNTLTVKIFSKLFILFQSTSERLLSKRGLKIFYGALFITMLNRFYPEGMYSFFPAE